MDQDLTIYKNYQDEMNLDKVQDLFLVGSKDVLPDNKLQFKPDDIKDYSKLISEDDVLKFKMNKMSSMEDATVDENAKQYGEHTNPKLETVPIPDTSANKLTMSRLFSF